LAERSKKLQQFQKRDALQKNWQGYVGFGRTNHCDSWPLTDWQNDPTVRRASMTSCARLLRRPAPCDPPDCALDGCHTGRDGQETGAVFEAKFMLPRSFSEEGAAEKHMAQLQHNMLVAGTMLSNQRRRQMG
jgi:hypothetical protein